MSDVARFTWDEDEGGWCAGPDIRFGPFEVLVRADDYDARAAENERLRAALAEAKRGKDLTDEVWHQFYWVWSNSRPDPYLGALEAAKRTVAERDALRAALENVQHGVCCPAQPGWADAGPCTCGLSAALAAKAAGDSVASPAPAPDVAPQ